MPIFRRKSQDGGIVRVPMNWQLPPGAAQAARSGGRRLLILLPLVVAVIVAQRNRRELFGADLPVRIAAAVVMLLLGWMVARAAGQWLRPKLARRVDPATAGTLNFLIRLTFGALTLVVALRFTGLTPETLAVGGAITAVVFGLAAQQTLGNLIAGLVLISARPFRVGERVRLQAGGVAGQIEGTAQALGLLYTVFAQGEDSILIPNSVVLSAAVVPLREPAGVDLRAHLRPDVKVTEVHHLLEQRVRTAIRGEFHIALEEVCADHVVVRVVATPEHNSDGARMADEILAALADITHVGDTSERALARA